MRHPNLPRLRKHSGLRRQPHTSDGHGPATRPLSSPESLPRSPRFCAAGHHRDMRAVLPKAGAASRKAAPRLAMRVSPKGKRGVNGAEQPAGKHQCLRPLRACARSNQPRAIVVGQHRLERANLAPGPPVIARQHQASRRHTRAIDGSLPHQRGIAEPHTLRQASATPARSHHCRHAACGSSSSSMTFASPLRHQRRRQARMADQAQIFRRIRSVFRPPPQARTEAQVEGMPKSNGWPSRIHHRLPTSAWSWRSGTRCRDGARETPAAATTVATTQMTAAS